MKLIAVKKVRCQTCRRTIKIREYYGFEGGWYSDHTCKRIKRKYAKRLRETLAISREIVAELIAEESK